MHNTDYDPTLVGTENGQRIARQFLEGDGYSDVSLEEMKQKIDDLVESSKVKGAEDLHKFAVAQRTAFYNALNIEA